MTLTSPSHGNIILVNNLYMRLLRICIRQSVPMSASQHGSLVYFTCPFISIATVYLVAVWLELGFIKWNAFQCPTNPTPQVLYQPAPQLPAAFCRDWHSRILSPLCWQAHRTRLLHRSRSNNPVILYCQRNCTFIMSVSQLTELVIEIIQ